jgi:hypothetical protein
MELSIENHNQLEAEKTSFFKKVYTIFEIIGYNRAARELRNLGYNEYAQNAYKMSQLKEKELRG